MDHQNFQRSLNIFHGDKRHLHIDLGKFRLSIRAEVLVPETTDNLKVPVKSRDHQDLLKKLRGLRQGVKMTGIDSARNQIISRPLGSAFGEHGCLDLQKSERVKVISHLFRHTVSEDQILLKPWPPKV